MGFWKDLASKAFWEVGATIGAMCPEVEEFMWDKAVRDYNKEIEKERNSSGSSYSSSGSYSKSSYSSSKSSSSKSSSSKKKSSSSKGNTHSYDTVNKGTKKREIHEYTEEEYITEKVFLQKVRRWCKSYVDRQYCGKYGDNEIACKKLEIPKGTKVYLSFGMEDENGSSGFAVTSLGIFGKESETSNVQLCSYEELAKYKMAMYGSWYYVNNKAVGKKYSELESLYDKIANEYQKVR